MSLHRRCDKCDQEIPSVAHMHTLVGPDRVQLVIMVGEQDENKWAHDRDLCLPCLLQEMQGHVARAQGQ